ncbi:hypothetical protein PVAP13_6NG274803 [Panicum virgatum]|uniref:Uncharacterized protein n=1 Tax=Panicum virgatum TaxID=38727 RepID=A0A8T0R236_PANVG|nr:hypothetical protein PVAP13_6NG274803 [Panicum virgatum]
MAASWVTPVLVWWGCKKMGGEIRRRWCRRIRDGAGCARWHPWRAWRPRSARSSPAWSRRPRARSGWPGPPPRRGARRCCGARSRRPAPRGGPAASPRCASACTPPRLEPRKGLDGDAPEVADLLVEGVLRPRQVGCVYGTSTQSVSG